MKKLLGLLVGLMVVVLVAGFFLPTAYKVEREAFISAPPARIHAFVGDLEQWPLWEPWRALDPEILVTPGHKATGVGASQSWVGKGGDGSLMFTSSSPERGVTFDLSFYGGQFRAASQIDYTPAPTGTTVRWRMEGDGGAAPIGPYFALLTKYMVGPQFELGLANLKQTVESAPQ